MYISLFIKTFVYVLMISSCMGCVAIQNFSELDSPIWRHEDQSILVDKAKEWISIVTFNIKFAEKIDETILAIREEAELKNADIILLQEMDTFGTIKIAEALEMSYVYVPAVLHGKELEYFGQSILSRYPILKIEKIILPHQAMSGRQRIGLYAILDVNGTYLHVYNVHLETMTMKRKKRADQLKKIIDHSESIPAAEAVIVAGDFNSFFPKDRKLFANLFDEKGFQWYSETLRYTARALKGILKNKIDHVFGRGITTSNIGVATQVYASDHYPVYFDFHINQ